VAERGVLVARVVYVKQEHSSRRFVILDTGMNDLLYTARSYAYPHPRGLCARPEGVARAAGSGHRRPVWPNAPTAFAKDRPNAAAAACIWLCVRRRRLLWLR